MQIDINSIFDVESFDKALITQSNNILPLYKKAIKDGNDALKTAFENNADTIQLVQTRAQFIDQILIHAFSFCFENCQQSLTLLAVGGYGRGELHPASDIDLMLLLDEKESAETRKKIEQFFMLLWDIKLEIGQSVRTIAECINEA